MKTIEISKLENYKGGDSLGGDIAAGFCAGMATSGAIYAIGATALVNAWNPVGWVTITFAVVGGGACAAAAMLD